MLSFLNCISDDIGQSTFGQVQPCGERLVEAKVRTEPGIFLGGAERRDKREMERKLSTWASAVRTCWGAGSVLQEWGRSNVL